MKILKRQKGMSLVEILVIIATSTILMGILMPAFNLARQQASRCLCLSNLRQMATATYSYTNDYDGHYPLAFCNKKIDNVRHYIAWDFITWKNWSTEVPEEHVEPGLLWLGQTIEKIQQCPSYSGSANWLSDPYSGYNYNISYIGMNETIFPANSSRTIDVKSPAKTVLFGDGEYSGGANKFMRAPFSNPRDASFSDSDRYAGTQGYRHSDTTNISFCDGHVSSQKELFINTSTSGKNILEEYNKTHDNKIGFLSQDNKLYDLK